MDLSKEFPELNSGQLTMLDRMLHEEITDAFSEGFLQASIYHGISIDDALKALKVYGIFNGCECDQEGEL